MYPMSHSFSLSLELRIFKARNIDPKYSAGDLFVRCYLSAGSDKRVRLESHEISSKSENLAWDQTFCLDCLGTQDSIKWLKQGTIVFELRRRTCLPCIGRMNGSKVVARAEMPWRDVVESPNAEIDKWVAMIPKNGCVCEETKPPAVQMAMKVQEYAQVIQREDIISERGWDECGRNSCVDYEFFAVEAALEAF